MTLFKALAIAFSFLSVSQVSGCAVYTVADAVVTTAATAVKVTAKTVGAAADLVIPDSGKTEEKKVAD
ncbi:MAG: hypothetical protein ABL931_04055, partial [Usitatibacteraceae bacterium]